jgi:hypothetical protein
MNLRQERIARQVSALLVMLTRVALEAEALNDQTIAEDLHQVVTIMARISDRAKQRRYHRVL